MNCQHIKSGAYCKVCDVAPEKKKRKRINPVSAQYKLELKVYSNNRIDFLATNPNCAACGGFALQVHHRAGRGVNLNNIDTWVPVCVECHVKIEHNPTWAKEQGYSVSRI